MLRCQVTISSLSLERKSRSTSESGKIAPSMGDQVRIRPRFIGCEANMSSPRKTAFPISAPAMPCVIVSIIRVYPMRTGRNILTDEYQRICFADDSTNAACVDAMTFESGHGGASRFLGDRDQQAT